MKAELWFSEAKFSFSLCEHGVIENYVALEPGARLLAVFEATSWEDAKHQKDEFLRSSNGFLSTHLPTSI